MACHASRALSPAQPSCSQCCSAPGRHLKALRSTAGHLSTALNTPRTWPLRRRGRAAAEKQIKSNQHTRPQAPESPPAPPGDRPVTLATPHLSGVTPRYETDTDDDIDVTKDDVTILLTAALIGVSTGCGVVLFNILIHALQADLVWRDLSLIHI